MNHVTKTPPTVEPISLGEMRAHLGISDASDTVRDSVISARITAAREWAEEYTRRRFITQTLVGYAHDFPWSCYHKNAVDLIAPLQSVTSVKYLDGDGNQQTLSASDYQVSTVNACVLPAYSKTWPDVREQPESVQIEYVAGYGDAGNAVPQSIKEAIMFIVSQWEIFQPAIEGMFRPLDVPNAAKQLLNSYIDYREIV